MTARLILETDVIDVSRPPVLIYGEPGAGKTSLAQTAERSLTLDFDGGLHRSAFRKTGMRFDRWEDVIEEQRSGRFDGYETIVTDTVGTCLDFMAQAIIAGNAKLGTRAGGLSLQGWGVLKTTFGNWLSLLRQDGKQVIMIAHQKEEKDGDSRVLRPDISGGSYSIVMNSADIVGYISYRNNQRFISWEPTDTYFAKNGARLKSGPIPDFSARPQFMAELLTTAKANLGHTAEASAAVARAVDEWSAWLKSDPQREAFNAKLPEVGKLANGAKVQVKAMLSAHAHTIGWKWDTASKTYLEPNPEAVPA